MFGEKDLCPSHGKLRVTHSFCPWSRTPTAMFMRGSTISLPRPLSCGCMHAPGTHHELRVTEVHLSMSLTALSRTETLCLWVLLYNSMVMFVLKRKHVPSGVGDRVVLNQMQELTLVLFPCIPWSSGADVTVKGQSWLLGLLRLRLLSKTKKNTPHRTLACHSLRWACLPNCGETRTICK